MLYFTCIEVVTEDPPTVMTTFEPAGRPGDERQYYMLEKENRCVVCGRMDGYIRKNVIPHEYRRSAYIVTRGRVFVWYGSLRNTLT